MSATWQQYIDSQLLEQGSVDEAMLVGKEDACVWASSPEFLPRLYE